MGGGKQFNNYEFTILQIHDSMNMYLYVGSFVCIYVYMLLGLLCLHNHVINP